jgi:hypothetical protein
MKTSGLTIVLLLSGLLTAAAAQDMDKKAVLKGNGVVMKDGKMMTVKGDQTEPMDKEMKLGGMTVATDGTVTLRDGSSMTLKDGDALMRDGIMGVVMKDGKPMAMWAGNKTSPMKRDHMMMMDGTKIMKDGSVMMKDGSNITLNEGDMIMADGSLKKAR